MKPKRINWEIGISSDSGPVRKINEDRADFFITKDKCGNDVVMAVVADGMGGYYAGDLASRMAVEMIQDWWHKRVSKLLKQRCFLERAFREIRQSMYDINEHLLKVKQRDQLKLGTTVSLLLLYQNEYVVCHVGDSRIYRMAKRRNNLAGKEQPMERGDTLDLLDCKNTVPLMGEKALIQLTEDHSWVQTQVERGYLSKEEARCHSKRSVLMQCLGINEKLVPFQSRNGHESADVFLLCSDGFYSLFPEKEIVHLLSHASGKNIDLQGMSDALVRLAIQSGATDNVTVVLLKSHLKEKQRFFRNWNWFNQKR